MEEKVEAGRREGSPSPLLHELLSEMNHLSATVLPGLEEGLERESRRRGNGAVNTMDMTAKASDVNLSNSVKAILESLSKADKESDVAALAMMSAFKDFSEVVPLCLSELQRGEALAAEKLSSLRGKGEVIEAKDGKEMEAEIGCAVGNLLPALERLREALLGSLSRAGGEKDALNVARVTAENARSSLETAIKESMDLRPASAAPDDSSPTPQAPVDTQALLEEIRDLMTEATSRRRKSSLPIHPAESLAPLTSSGTPDNIVVGVGAQPTEEALLSVGEVEKLLEQEIGGIDDGEGRDREGGEHEQMDVEGAVLAVVDDPEVPEGIKRRLKAKLLRKKLGALEKKRIGDVSARLMAEQAEEMATLKVLADVEKHNLDQELSQAGVTEDEREALLETLDEDQRLIESTLEAERVRMEDGVRVALAARKMHTGKQDLLQKGDEHATEKLDIQLEKEINELHQKHEAELSAILEAQAEETEGESPRGSTPREAKELTPREGVEAAPTPFSGEKVSTANDSKRKALKEAHARQMALLEATIESDARRSKSALQGRLRARRLHREAELLQTGSSVAEVAGLTADELAVEEAKEVEELDEALKKKRETALEKEAALQSEVLDKSEGEPLDVEMESERMRQDNRQRLADIETALQGQREARKIDLSEQIQARRRRKEAELDRVSASPEEKREALADITRLEELETEALEETLQAERTQELREARALIAGVDTAGLGNEAGQTTFALKELHLAASDKLEADLSSKERVASKALKSRLLAKRAEREARLVEEEGISAAEAVCRAQEELLQEEENARREMSQKMADSRRKAIDAAAKKEEEDVARAGEGQSMQDRAERLLEEHRQRDLELRSALKATARKRRDALEKRLASKRRAYPLPSSPPESAATAMEALLAGEETMRSELERDITSDYERLDNEAQDYEKAIMEIVSNAEAGAARRSEDLRRLHEREIVALAERAEDKRKGALLRLRQRREAAKATREEQMRADGATEEELVASLIKAEEEGNVEAKKLDEALRSAEMADTEIVKAKQARALAEGASMREEAARIRREHARDQAVLEEDLSDHRQRMESSLARRLRSRRKARVAQLKSEGMGEDDLQLQEALHTLDAEEQRDAKKLEGILSAMEEATLVAARKAQVFALADEEGSRAEAAQLRVQHKASELKLKELLQAEGGARKSRLRQRIAGRAKARAEEMQEEGRAPEEVEAEIEAIKSAGEEEERRIEEVMHAQAQSQVEQLCQRAKEEEANIEARQCAARELRAKYEGAGAELAQQFEDKKATRKAALAARLKAQKEKKEAEMVAAGAMKEQTLLELAKLEREAEESARQLEEELQKEHAALLEKENKKIEEEEAVARAAQVASESARQAAEEEVQRMRRLHEEQEIIMEEALENKRRQRQKVLAEKLQKRKTEKMAAARNRKHHEEAELEIERAEDQAALEYELQQEASRQLEENLKKQARAEAAARSAVEAARVEAEAKASVAREEHERLSLELESQMASRKAAQEGKLRERLAQKRREREAQLERDKEDKAAVEAAKLALEEEEARELAVLERELRKEKVRLEEEQRMRMAEEHARKELEEREAAEAESRRKAEAQKEAEDRLRSLQKEHEEQSAALEEKMFSERRARENKLRERLEKKRKAKKDEMKAAALSAEERREEEDILEAQEKAEKERLKQQVEQENAQCKEEQRLAFEEAARAAAEEAERAAEEAAAAAAWAKAKEAATEAAERAKRVEREEFERKALHLKEESKTGHEEAKKALAGKSAVTKARLADRLARRKAKAESARSELEAAQRLEEQALRQRHKEEVAQAAATAAAAAAAASGPSDLTWEAVVARGMEGPQGPGEDEQGREARVLKLVLEAGLVPEDSIGTCVETVLSGRHAAESTDLLAAQYKERATRLGESLRGLLEAKNQARKETLQRLSSEGVTGQDERADALSEIDDDFSQRQRQLEMDIVQEMETAQLKQQVELRQRQLKEIANTVKDLVPEASLERLHETDAQRQQQELEEYQACMEEEKQKRLRKMEEERSQFEAELHQRHEEAIRKLKEEEERALAVEREAQEARMQEKKAELERAQQEAQKRLEDQTGQVNAQEKEALLAQFKKDQMESLAAVKAEGVSQHNKLQEKLAQRRAKKAKDLEEKAARELGKKEERNARAMKEYQRQADQVALFTAQAQEALEEDTDVQRGLKLNMSAEAVTLAREASLVGATNEVKEKLKHDMAEFESKKRIQRQTSGSSIATTGVGRGGTKSGTVENAAAAAAAAAEAAAAAATAAEKQYIQISSKLEGVSALIEALQTAQADQRPSSTTLQNNNLEERTPSGPRAPAYQDAEDAAMIPSGEELKVIPRDSLPVQVLARLEFGERLISVLGMSSKIRVEIAQNLPPCGELRGGAGGRTEMRGEGTTNSNAFRNSYLWDESAGILYVHVRRTSSSGDLGLVLVHAAAHLRVDPPDMKNDLDPRFTQHFHSALKVLTQELFKGQPGTAAGPTPSGAGPSGFQGVARLWGEWAGASVGAVTEQDSRTNKSRLGMPQLAEDGFLDGNGTPRRLPGVLMGGGRGAGNKEDFNGSFGEEALTKRLEKYARASGQTRLVEMLSRHAKDQQDKFTLSDDEDEDAVSDAEDSAYMADFTEEDSVSLSHSRSPRHRTGGGGGSNSPCDRRSPRSTGSIDNGVRPASPRRSTSRSHGGGWAPPVMGTREPPRGVAALREGAVAAEENGGTSGFVAQEGGKVLTEDGREAETDG
ncbi:unnamed protein product [Discosporangium mesarthrocarpum]